MGKKIRTISFKNVVDSVIVSNDNSYFMLIHIFFHVLIYLNTFNIEAPLLSKSLQLIEEVKCANFYEK